MTAKVLDYVNIVIVRGAISTDAKLTIKNVSIYLEFIFYWCKNCYISYPRFMEQLKQFK
jgi:hypothetical protein